MYPYAEEIGSGKNLRDEMLAPFPRTDYAVRKNRQEYYAIITHMDDQIGKIMEELRRTGQDKNTVVIFTSDHGLAVGEHGFMGKQNMYEASMRVPLIFAGPGIKAGHRVDELVYFQDVVPTVLGMAKAPIPDHVDYQCLLAMMNCGEAESRYRAVYGAYMGTQRMIRDERYKMLIYPVAKKVRLFDLENDPYEMNDLASLPEYKPVMDNLFMHFKELQIEVKDPLDVTYWYERFQN